MCGGIMAEHKFAIERQAVNEATCLSVETITKSLKKRAYDVIISDDAERFVCNYVYYNSLRFVEQHGNKSLFVHVPIFFQN
ncbi:pyrrolidone-carboxylate peptidase [Senna tora]|uniref:Pyrrolidone-carboxylate peptidase n=1 Tax=Senna tora TaxID=362788 RepID=A0A834WJR3_9FABA|nr:pyrrolidone-carboxylate peptidase [Senna tora]